MDRILPWSTLVCVIVVGILCAMNTIWSVITLATVNQLERDNSAVLLRFTKTSQENHDLYMKELNRMQRELQAMKVMRQKDQDKRWALDFREGECVIKDRHTGKEYQYFGDKLCIKMEEGLQDWRELNAAEIQQLSKDFPHLIKQKK